MPSEIASDEVIGSSIAPLGTEEYVEQAYFFGLLCERLRENVPAQEALVVIREEVLATTKLPMAIDFLLTDLRHSGIMSSAMAKMEHYFTPFQTYIMKQGEDESGRFDLRVGLDVLAAEARYRAGLPIAGQYQSVQPSVQGLFLYQFEVLCRNRLGYDGGLTAIAGDSAYPEQWKRWILAIRRQVGMVDIADMLYVQSEHAANRAKKNGMAPGEKPLFGEREGRIALANRKKNPLYLFNSLHRQLGHPEIPAPRPTDPEEFLLPQLARRTEQLEQRIRLLEEEQRGGIDLSQFYQKPAESDGLTD